MFVDRRIEIADEAPVAMTSATGSGIVPNSRVIDLTTGAPPFLALRDLGGGEPLYLVISVDQVFTGAGASARFQLVSADNAALTANRTPHVDTTALPVTFWTLGRTAIYLLPSENTYRRYLGMWMFVSGGDVTGGRVSAYLTHQAPRFVHYPDAI